MAQEVKDLALSLEQIGSQVRSLAQELPQAADVAPSPPKKDSLTPRTGTGVILTGLKKCLILVAITGEPFC